MNRKKLPEQTRTVPVRREAFVPFKAECSRHGLKMTDAATSAIREMTAKLQGLAPACDAKLAAN